MAIDGAVLGENVVVGASVGCAEGEIDGIMDAVGSALGLFVGDAVGEAEGIIEGERLGSAEGISLGAPVLGLADGLKDAVGMLLELGVEVGAIVGLVLTLSGLADGERGSASVSNEGDRDDSTSSDLVSSSATTIAPTKIPTVIMMAKTKVFQYWSTTLHLDFRRRRFFRATDTVAMTVPSSCDAVSVE